MSFTATGLAEEVRDRHREFTGAIKELRDALSALRVDVAKFNTRLGWTKGLGMMLAGSAFTILILAFSGAYRATQFEDAIFALQKDFSQAEVAVVTLEKDFARIESAVVGLQKSSAEMRNDSRSRDGSLDRALESLGRIEKTLAQTPSAKSALK